MHRACTGTVCWCKLMMYPLSRFQIAQNGVWRSLCFFRFDDVHEVCSEVETCVLFVKKQVLL